MEHNNMITNAGSKTTQSLTDIYLVEMTLLLMILTSGIIWEEKNYKWWMWFFEIFSATMKTWVKKLSAKKGSAMI